MVREVQLTDVDQVSRLTEQLGWGPTTLARWERLWRDNPATDDRTAGGWVLEESGQIVGYLCNIARRYRFGETILRAASAGSLVVLPEYRGLSLQLFLQYAKQPHVDLLLNTTAAPHVAKICEFLKFDRIPQPDYDVSLYWVVNAREFVGAALRKKRVPAPLVHLGSGLAAPAALYFRWKHRLDAAPPAGVRLTTTTPAGIDESFDKLWHRVTGSRERLLAFRDSASLRWHLTHDSSSQWPFLVTAHRGDNLVGYTAVVRQDAPHLGLTRARFADVFVDDDAASLTGAIIARSVLEAAQRNVAMVELIGFPPPLRKASTELRPFELRSGSWPFLYRAREPSLHRLLARQEVWYASLFDGDGSV